MKAKEFIDESIRVREYLLRVDKSKRPKGEVYASLKKIKRWMEFYPNATEEQYIKFIANYAKDFETIIPGSGNSRAPKINEQLYAFIRKGRKTD